MQTQTYPQTATRRPALSMEAKRESWEDGYAHAITQAGNYQTYARSPEHYAAGYDRGQDWLERNGLAN